MKTSLFLTVLVVVLAAFASNDQTKTPVTCIMDVALLDLQGPNYEVDDLCVAAGDKVTVVIRISSGSRYATQASLSPCREQQPLVSLQYDATGVPGNVSLLLWLNVGHDVVDSAMYSFSPSTDLFTSHRVVGDLRATIFNFAIAQRCVTDDANDEDFAPGPKVRDWAPPRQDDDSVSPASKLTPPDHPPHFPSVLTDRHRRDTDTTTTDTQRDVDMSTPVSEGFLPTEPRQRQAEEEEEDEVMMMPSDEPLYQGGEVIDNPLRSLVQGQDDFPEGLASVQRSGDAGSSSFVVSVDESVPSDEFETVSSSGEGMMQQAENAEGASDGKVYAQGNDSDSNGDRDGEGATTPTDRLTTVDPALLRLADMIAKVRAAMSTPFTTLAQAPGKLRSSVDQSGVFDDERNNAGIRTVATPTATTTLSTPSDQLPGTENTFRLDIIDNFDDDSLLVEARRLTVSPFVGGRVTAVEDDVREEESDAVDSYDLLNVTASLYSGLSSNAVTDLQVFAGAATAVDGLNVPQVDETNLQDTTVTTTTTTTTTITTAPRSDSTPFATTASEVFARAQPAESANTTTDSDGKSDGGQNGGLLHNVAGDDGDTTVASTASIFSPAARVTTPSINSNAEDSTTGVPSTKGASNTDLTQQTTTDDEPSQTTAAADTTASSGSTTAAQPRSTARSFTATPPSDGDVTVSEENSTTTTPTTTTTTRVTPSVENTTLMVGSSGNSSGLALSPDTSSVEDDTFWPIVAALVIGIPSIIVFGIAITVIHKRRLASPARLRAASMYPSL